MTKNKLYSYSDLISITSFEGRLNYLKLDGLVGKQTFGPERYFNQAFYHSTEWSRLRREIIFRDDGCDLAHIDRPIGNRIFIHHMNPITIDDILSQTPILLDPEYLVCVSRETHNFLHFGEKKLLFFPRERTKGDTKLW